MLLMDSVDSGQRGRTGSEVSVLALAEGKKCAVMLDVTSVATSEPVSCVSPPAAFASTSRPSVNSVSYFFLWQRRTQLEGF